MERSISVLRSMGERLIAGMYQKTSLFLFFASASEASKSARQLTALPALAASAEGVVRIFLLEFWAGERTASAVTAAVKRRTRME